MRAVQKLMYQVKLSGVDEIDLKACQDLLEEAFNEENSREILILIDSALNRTDLGERPIEEIERLSQLVPPVPSEREDLQVELTLRARAAALWNADWETPMFLELVDVLSEGTFAAYRASMSARVEKAATSYQEALANPDELTIEALVRHKLFLEGLEHLRESLDYLESDPEESLRLAEQGNRLLIAVQLFADRYNSGWFKVRGGFAPPYPVHGGNDVDGTELYVAAAVIDGQKVPGSSRAPFRQALVAHNGQAFVASDFEMLSDLRVNWVDPDDEAFLRALRPPAVGSAEPWCVARGYHEGRWLIGKARPDDETCRVPFGQGEPECEDFHILVQTD